ncbi:MULTISPECIES: hypothetical protein [unclassified Streptomyces]|uniref:hypothetical protein n=1 Tax=unclassified Streptomyces TaxID=2593676 RepID=UPI002E81F00A|nr:hypothetical protein [Streptomyces sp. NBC_00589]WTI35386.1 hypothetical protein OIC96_10495 [Streptomyces sp. NBC_00775]WUB30940.1 hypothetical protein OHA51_39235 [Streptomyces sp. NBC_00589]
MTEAAGPSVEGAREWAERLGWSYGLIAPDSVERGAALARLDAARAEAQAARARYNEAWLRASRAGSEDWHQEPSVVAAQRLYEEAGSRCLPEALWHAPYRDDIRMSPKLPFALLFLEWEARFPQEWTQHAKAWGTKQALIRDLARRSPSDEAVKAKLLALVEVVVQRAYRCKDREYVRVARTLDGDDLRTRLHRAHHMENPWAQLHAGYVLWLLDHPEVPNTRHVWRTWLTDPRSRCP